MAIVWEPNWSRRRPYIAFIPKAPMTRYISEKLSKDNMSEMISINIARGDHGMNGINEKMICLVRGLSTILWINSVK